MRRTRGKIFFGWWTVLVTGVLSGLGHGFYGYGVSVFFKDIAAELSLSRAVTSVAAGIGRIEGGITSPFVGWLADKYGPRWIIIVGICIAAIGMTFMNFVTSMWTYFVAWGVLTGVGLNIGLTIAVDKTLTDWFIRRRGLAHGIKFALIGVGGVIAVPVVTWLVATQGWRMTCLLWGMIMLAGTPLVWFFVKQQRPEYYGLLPDGAQVESYPQTGTDGMLDRGIEYASSLEETEFTLRQTLRTRTYWFLAVAFSVQTMIVGGFNIHTIPFLTDLGIDPTIASGMMAMMVFFTIPGRFLGGVIADRIGKSRLQFLLAGAFFLQAVGIGIFILNQSIPALYVLLIFYGFSSGACTPLYLVILGRYFGRKAFGSILGSAFLFRAPLSLIAPIYTGWVYDTSGSYIGAFKLFAALATFAALLLSQVRAPKLPAAGTDIKRFM